MSPLPRIDTARVLRTPEDRFTRIADFPYVPKYVDIGGLRIATID